MSYPKGCAATPDGSILYFVEAGGGGTRYMYLRRVDLSTREVTTICGGGGTGNSALVGTGTPSLRLYGTDEGYVGQHASFDEPQGLALSSDVTTAYVVDKGVHRVRQVILATGMVTTLAGSTQGYANGVGTNAMFYDPEGIAYGPGGILYVADGRNYRIRQINIGTRMVTTLTGAGTLGNADGVSAVATFRQPTGISLTADGMRMLVSDAQSHLIREVLPFGAAAADAAVQRPPPPSPPPPLPLRFLRQNTRPGGIDLDNGGQIVEGGWGLLRTGGYAWAAYANMRRSDWNDPPADGGYTRKYRNDNAWTATKPDGTVACWGLDEFGGKSATGCPNLAPPKPISYVFSSRNRFCYRVHPPVATLYTQLPLCT